MMADLHPMRASPLRPFGLCHVDLCGPVLVKSYIQGRPNKKHWLLVAACGATSAAHAEVIADYSASAVLAGMIKFTNIYHMPDRIVSDAGTQFVQLMKKMAEWAQSKNVEWKIVPAGGQFQNGCAERVIALLKNQLMPILETTKTDLLQLQVLVSSAVSMVNSRPIGVLKNCDTLEALDIITPDSFLRGPRPRGPMACVDGVVSLHSHARQIQNVLDDLWHKWDMQVLPSLVQSGKWSKAQQKLKVGSVCYMRDVNLVRGAWKLCRVVTAEQDRQGQVHTAVVQYVGPNGKKKTTTKATRDLAVLVE